MLRIISTLALIVLLPQNLKSQILPREGSALNYRLIGFSFPSKEGVTNYNLEIASGNYKTEDSFRKNIINWRAQFQLLPESNDKYEEGSSSAPNLGLPSQGF